MDGKKVMFNKMGIMILFIVSLALSMGMVSAGDTSSGDVTNISAVNGDVHVNSNNLAADPVKVKGQKVYSAGGNSKIYVAANGSDENGDGTLDNPYRSLNSAISHSAGASTIYMFNGTYRGVNNTNLIIDKTLIISAWDGAVTLDGEGKSQIFDITSDGNLTLNGLKLINGYAGEESTSGAIINRGELTINNSAFSNNNGFLGGAILNYGSLTVLNSTFKTNKATNYAGGIANFGTTNVHNSQFIENTGGGLFNAGNMSVISSKFTSSSIICDNFGSNRNSVTITNASFADSMVTSKGNTVYIYNSSFVDSSYSAVQLENSNATITGSSFGRYAASVGVNSTLNITYSVILGTISTSGVNSTAYASYNWWGSNKVPTLYNVVVDKWVILTFVSDKSPIPSKTNATVTAVFKYTDGKNVFNLGKTYLPSRFISFETDNGDFSPPNGYMVNNSFSTTYLNNTEDTWIYACVDNQKVRLVIGTGWTDYSIYVSNDGDDYYGDGSRDNPYKTLQKAVSKALNGNKIYIYAGTYTGLYNTDLHINKYLTFSSFNGDVLIYRYSNINLFNITEFGQLNLNNINTCSNMSYNVLLINNGGGVLVLNNCTINNSTGCIGGSGDVKAYNSKFYNIVGYAIQSNGNLTVIKSSFTNISIPNTSIYDRAIIRSCGNLTVINSTFINNNLNAIYAEWSSGSSALINGSNFTNNTGGVTFYNFDQGAAVENCKFIDNTGSCVIQASIINNSLFINNTGRGSIRGSIIINGDYNSEPKNLTISNSTFINNSNVVDDYEDYNSNGVIFNGGNLTVTQCTFSNNCAAYGGAIYNLGDLNVSYSVFVNNTAKYLAADVYNRMGTAYLLSNWWGSNSGPTSEKVYRFLGDVYAYNWVIMTLTINNNVLNASLDKVTDLNGTIHNLAGVLPSREVFFKGTNTNISPEHENLTNNQALATITNSDKDFTANAAIDNQSLDLTIRNNSTVIDIDNAAFYGKGNVYKIILRNVNGYLISNQTLKVTFTDKNGKSEAYSVITDENGMATILLNNTIGVYNVHVIYGGNGYFKGSQADAIIQILTSITKIVSYDGTFYGTGNVFYADLYDFNGKGVAGQKISFNISHGNESKIYYSVTNDQGRTGVVVNFSQGKYNVKMSFAGNGWYGSSSSTSSFTISPINTSVTLETSVVYGRGNPYIVKVRDANGNVLRNESITLIISQGNQNETFNLKTDVNGTAGLMINLYPGLYNVTVKYGGNGLYKSSSAKGTLTINRVDTKLRADSVISNFNNIYEVTLTDIYGRPLAGESVNITIMNQKFNKTYSAVTDSKGVASLLINLDVGNYVVVDNFYTNGWYGSTTTASTLIISNITTPADYFVYNNMTNAQIQHILDNCVVYSNIIFMGGQYSNLKLIVSRPVNIKSKGTVIIMGNGSGTAFTVNANATIQGLVIKNYGTGILNKASTVSIVNNTFAGNVNGVVNYGSGSGVKISTNNVFQSSKGSAIYNYGNNLTFRGFKLVNNKVGITNKGSNVDILYNTISGGEYGIVNSQKATDINYNTVSSASKSGIYNTGSSSKIGHNTLKNNYYGINNKGSASTIAYNVVSGGSKGIVNSAGSVTISGNSVKSVTGYGVYNSGSSAKIYKNTLTGLNKGYGIYLTSSVKSNLIQSNTVSKFYYGLSDAGYKNTLQSNVLKYNKVGLYLYKTAKYSTVTSNQVYKNTNYGVYNKGYKTTLYKNQITYNTKYGLATVKSVKNTKNTIKKNKVNTKLIK
ncbi:right-handed parallel beta-helix repeat-containing protein [Methanobacterium veterum]|uniref:Right-handed parallel beta-helix repeat-containing protein n=2 Tax=Methanobacterium TaxID=2160 RepID=A0A9E5DHD3_9EURY|nr:right-handed parallel beta-helix repeat-containing protein [Methanobacterium veterum]MCZ3365606.1 right-handed parallel beta-helix repeat-containing protein [Methanobacterium veterum]MCZ3371069.1 right-handed parallel beta-helix repeat-containing protein [Methanobacterium veterum]